MSATPAPAALDATAFVLRLGRGLHAHGYPAHRLEEALGAVARRLGLEGQFFSTPTALFASFGGHAEQRTFQVRVEPGRVDLGRLARLDEVAKRVARGEWCPVEGSRHIDAVGESAATHGRALTTLSHALASAAAVCFLDGGVREVAAATAIGLSTGLLALGAERHTGLARVFEVVAATLAALLASLAPLLLGPLSAYLATVAGLIVLIPGFTLTVAMTELATRHLVSGTARLMGALGTFLMIGFGVALGSHLGARIAGPPAGDTALVPLPLLALPVALVVAPLSLAVLLRAEGRDAWPTLLSGACAFAGARAGAAWLGPELGPFVGALGVGLWGNTYARLFDRPSSVPVVPGLLLLVPGSLGFRSLAALLAHDTLPGLEAAFRMVLAAVSLVTGLLFANVLLPPPPLVPPARAQR